MPRIARSLAAALVAVLLASCASAPRGRPPCTDREFSEVDLVIAVQFFSPAVRIEANGHRKFRIDATYPSLYGVDPGDSPAYYQILQRGKQAFDMHYRLLEEDPGYRARFRATEREALARLGGNLRISDAEGRRLIYPLFLRACIYHDIFARLGPPPVTDNPYYRGKDDPEIWGSDRSPFFSIHYVSAKDWPASVLPFHYCAGTGGLTISGGKDEPHVRAMLWLREHDPRFRADWEAVLRKVRPEAKKVDPLDPEAARRVTNLWRRLLLEGGGDSLAARIEARVRQEEQERGEKGEPPGEPAEAR